MNVPNKQENKCGKHLREKEEYFCSTSCYPQHGDEMALYESLGFAQHPFSKTNADEEEFLHEYFVPPPYFDAIIGDALSP